MDLTEIFFFLTFEFFAKLTSFCEEAFKFLIAEINIGNITLSMWELIGGSSLIILLTAWFIAKVAPIL